MIKKKSLVKRRVEGIEVPCIQPVGGQAERFTEPLIMHKLPCAEELDRVAHVGIVAHAENVVVGRAGLLL